MEPDGLLTSPEVCRLAGASYRQLDYWTRLGVVAPSRPGSGSGSVRGWSVEEAALVRVCERLSRLGAQAPIMKLAVDVLRSFPELWSGKAVVTADGAIRPAGIASSVDGWLIDLCSCREYVGAEPVAWPAAV